MQAIQYCHKVHPNVHLDIKLENIKVGKGDEIIICEFRMYSFLLTNERDSERDNCNDLKYVPPEMLDQKVTTDQKCVDVWLAGVMLYMLLTKEYPFG